MLRNLAWVAVAAAIVGMSAHAPAFAASVAVDPVTRYAHITYGVPENAPDEVLVRCAWSPKEGGDWQPAKVWPFVSETALRLVRDAEWQEWSQGRVIERRAAGLTRTVVFNPYPEAQSEGKVAIRFRIEVAMPDGQVLATDETPIEADNSDVVYLEDWSAVLNESAVAKGGAPEGRQWAWRTGLEAAQGVTYGNALFGNAGPEQELPQLAYSLDLRGAYALFVCTAPGQGAVRLRLSGDERSDPLASEHLHEEVLWRWTAMDRQNLLLKQSHAYTGYTPAHIDYVKLVPLTPELVEELDVAFGGAPDKIVAGYWEPYSWAFHDNVRETLQHREPMTAFAEARITIVDTQIGRFGAKVVYESRETDRLLYATRGDPIGTVAHPTTDNVGKMQQYTNTLDATLRYGRELGRRVHANFGASNCYPGSPLQGDFSKAHPEWMRGSMLRFEAPEVKDYVLGLYREALEIGAPGLSIDFCRYPETIADAETCNAFLRDLRALANAFGEIRGERVPILVRFPGTGVRRHAFFDYATWAREGWVDYVCPSNIQGRHLHIDMAPYIEATNGTACTLLPALDGLGWGQPLPGPFLWRVARLYDRGVAGIYVYQADARVLGRPVDRRTMRMLASSEAVRRFWEEDGRLRPQRSKGIYITSPLQVEGWHGWQRLRIWVEGVDMGALEVYLDGELENRWAGPPYLLGAEDNASDGIIPSGDHELRIRVRDGDGWLEQAFSVHGA